MSSDCFGPTPQFNDMDFLRLAPRHHNMDSADDGEPGRTLSINEANLAYPFCLPPLTEDECNQRINRQRIKTATATADSDYRSKQLAEMKRIFDQDPSLDQFYPYPLRDDAENRPRPHPFFTPGSFTTLSDFHLSTPFPCREPVVPYLYSPPNDDESNDYLSNSLWRADRERAEESRANREDFKELPPSTSAPSPPPAYNPAFDLPFSIDPFPCCNIEKTPLPSFNKQHYHPLTCDIANLTEHTYTGTPSALEKGAHKPRARRVRWAAFIGALMGLSLALAIWLIVIYVQFYGRGGCVL